MDNGSRRRIEKSRLPGEESQILEPRPRPASWNDAREVRGVGRRDVRRGFLHTSTYKFSMKYEIGFGRAYWSS